MNFSKLMCLVKHKFGRWRRASRTVTLRKCPLDLRLLALQTGGLEMLRSRVCVRCGVQEWQIKARRKSPRKLTLLREVAGLEGAVATDNELQFAPIAVSA